MARVNLQKLTPLPVVASSGSRVRLPIRKTLFIISSCSLLDNHLAHDVVVDAHLSVDFGLSGGVAFNVHKDVDAFRLFVDLVGELLHTPVFHRNEGAEFTSQRFVLADDLTSLFIVDVAANNVENFVIIHVDLLLDLMPLAGKETPCGA